jgi:hypothetical protein
LILLVVLALTVGSMVFVPGARSVLPIEQFTGEPPGPFHPDESAALFVGVQKFTHDRTLDPVRFAVDDAIDLAYAFALDPRVGLVRPHRVVLALSGDPRKPESQRRLAELRKAGAVVSKAGLSDVRVLLEQQAVRVGKNGLFIVSFATHGFSRDGVPYVLTASSIFRDHDTSLSAAKVFDIAAAAPRSLIFVDACRERVQTDARPGVPHPESAAPLIKAMATVAGQVVFYGAAAGKYAYDHPTRRNGVFTASVLDGLQCRAKANKDGIITADALSTYVEKNVRQWIRTNRDLRIGSAIQVSMDGQAKWMPLADCSGPPPPPPIAQPARVALLGSALEAFGPDGVSLWKRELKSRVVHAEVSDVDSDGTNDVIAGAGEDVVAFDARGTRMWSADTGRSLRKVVTGASFRKHPRTIAALSFDGGVSTLSAIDVKGIVSSYTHPGRILDLHIARQTNRHTPKILGATAKHVFMLDPKKMGTGKELWFATLDAAHEIKRMEIVEPAEKGSREIVVHTSRGAILRLDFAGHALDAKPSVPFRLIAR